jgi:CYTH domain-containing protein/predicted ATPase
MEGQVKQIVITGGPCSGKSEALKIIPERLNALGYSVVVLREVAEEIFSSIFPIGVKDIREFAQKYPEKYCAAEEQMFLEIMAKLKIRRNLARICGSEKTVILLDRGPMDTLAYMPEARERFFEFVMRNGYSVYDARDSFDGVAHLVTAADGKEEFYRQTEVRIETPEEARALDKETQWVWVGAPHLWIIDNSTGFDAKMDRLFYAILRILGEPEPLEIERKFLLARRPDFRKTIMRRAEILFIEQIYLNDGASRIRKRKTMRYGHGRKQGDSTAYYKTIKAEISPGVKREDEGLISCYDYDHLKGFKDFNRAVVRKSRYCFVHNNQYFELDEFISPPRARGMWVLEVELLGIDDPVDLPPFLDVGKEVTGDSLYLNYEIARRK